jgi:Penicillinase repressor
VNPPILEQELVKSRRFKLEFYDDQGVRHSITIDGQITREKVGKLLDLVEVMAGTPRATASALSLSPRKFDRLASAVISQLKDKSFAAAEAKKVFETTFSEKIPLSTVSTYLGRLVERGVLERGEKGRAVSYQIRSEEPKSLLSLRP